MPETIPVPDLRIAGTVQRYITGAETIRLTAFNSASGVRLSLSGRRFPYGGNSLSEFRADLTPTTNRAATTLDFSPGEGWLLGLAVRVVAGSPLEGQTYCVVEIGNGSGTTFQAFDTLIADTVTAAHRVAWPGSPVRSPLDSAGAVRSIVGSTPGAGAEISESVPTGARWELLMFRATYTTSATVGNRNPILLLDDGANRWVSEPYLGVTAASGNGTAEWSQGSVGNAAIVGQNPNGFIPPNNRLPAGSRVRTLTVNIAVGDQYSAPTYLVREWLEGA